MNKLKLIILAVFTPLLIFGVAQPAHAFDLFPNDTVCSGKAANSPTCQQAGSEGGGGNRITGPRNVLKIAATLIAMIAGIAAVIMILISGFTMITSGGNSEKVSASRRRLIAAIIGLVIVAMSWTIITFIITQLT